MDWSSEQRSGDGEIYLGVITIDLSLEWMAFSRNPLQSGKKKKILGGTLRRNANMQEMHRKIGLYLRD